jgi:hypothetical protein
MAKKLLGKINLSCRASLVKALAEDNHHIRPFLPSNDPEGIPRA